MGWEGFSDAIEDERLKVLILVSDVPFIYEGPKIAEDRRTKGRKGVKTEEHLLQHWSARPAELEQLLTKLFKWKHEQFPFREVLLMSGDLRVGMTSDVRDNELGLNIPQIVTSPITDEVAEF